MEKACSSMRIVSTGDSATSNVAALREPVPIAIVFRAGKSRGEHAIEDTLVRMKSGRMRREFLPTVKDESRSSALKSIEVSFWNTLSLKTISERLGASGNQ